MYILSQDQIAQFFQVSAEEKVQVNSLLEFILLLYTKYWFTTPLASSAAGDYITFMSNVLEYRKMNARLSYAVLSSS